MKIILSAFSGQMMSSPMDVPENTTPYFKMVLVQPIQAYVDNLSNTPLMSGPLNTVCTFEWNGKINVYENVICREYVLTKIN